mmetsp:Transcript_15843/g.33022  ORF Transcript_15843/g.33022 Transcript_15843/m.33022 type:complete len:309 (-) Transcript_15843:68-994(-)
MSMCIFPFPFSLRAPLFPSTASTLFLPPLLLPPLPINLLLPPKSWTLRHILLLLLLVPRHLLLLLLHLHLRILKSTHLHLQIPRASQPPRLFENFHPIGMRILLFLRLSHSGLESLGLRHPSREDGRVVVGESVVEGFETDESLFEPGGCSGRGGEGGCVGGEESLFLILLQVAIPNTGTLRIRIHALLIHDWPRQNHHTPLERGGPRLLQFLGEVPIGIFHVGVGRGRGGSGGGGAVDGAVARVGEEGGALRWRAWRFDVLCIAVGAVVGGGAAHDGRDVCVYVCVCVCVGRDGDALANRKNDCQAG